MVGGGCGGRIVGVIHAIRTEEDNNQANEKWGEII